MKYSLKKNTDKLFELRPHQDVIEIMSGESEVELIAYFEGASQALFEWYNNHNNRISNSPSEEEDEEDTGDFINNVYYVQKKDGTAETNLIKTKKYGVFVNRTTAILTISNPKFEDFGLYTLRVKYLLGHIGYIREVAFQLRVKGKLNEFDARAQSNRTSHSFRFLFNFRETNCVCKRKFR